MATPILRVVLSSLLVWGSALLVPHHLYAQTPASAPAAVTTFTDVSTQAGFSGCSTCQLNSSWAHAWADYDGDGYVDIITLGHVQPQTGSISQLWHNNGDGTFTDVTYQVGLVPHDADATMGLFGLILIMMAIRMFLFLRKSGLRHLNTTAYGTITVMGPSLT